MQFELRDDLLEDQEKCRKILNNIHTYLTHQKLLALNAMYRFRTLHQLTYIPELIVQGSTGLFLISGSYGLDSPWLPLAGGIIDVLLLAYSPIRSYFAFEFKENKMSQAVEIIDKAIQHIHLYLLIDESASENLQNDLEKALQISLEIEKYLPKYHE